MNNNKNKLANINKYSMIFILTIFFLAITTIGYAQDPKFITMGTASMGGMYYPSGVALAKILEPAFPNTKVNARTTGGVLDNINKIGKKEIELGIGYNPVVSLAVKGEGAYENKPTTWLRGLTQLYPDYTLIVVANDVSKIADLKGKAVGTGTAGSSAYLDIAAHLSAAGLDITKDIKSNPVAFAEAADMLKDGHIVACLQYGKTNPTVAEILFSKRGKILSLTEDEIKKLVEINPAYVPAIIPAGTYTRQDIDVYVVSAPNVLLAHEDMSEEVAYKIVKTFFTNIDELQGMVKTYKELEFKNALKGMVVPLHPGAIKYFKEVGLL